MNYTKEIQARSKMWLSRGLSPQPSVVFAKEKQNIYSLTGWQVVAKGCWLHQLGYWDCFGLLANCYLSPVLCRKGAKTNSLPKCVKLQKVQTGNGEWLPSK